MESKRKTSPETKKRKRKATCPICNVEVKFPSLMSYLGHNMRKAEEKEDTSKLSRTYIDQFLATKEFSTLCGIEYHGINNLRGTRKEVSEAYAVLKAVRLCLPKNQTLNDTFLIDLCSGKSLTIALSKLTHPQGSYLAVDKLKEHEISHHVPYWCQDIRPPVFAQGITERIEAELPKTPILVGMHLCGILSELAIELFKTNTKLHALVLCPCCLPRRKSGVAETIRNRNDKAENLYDGWANHLFDLVKEIKGVTVHRYRDEHMHTDRNFIIWVTR